jgi:hypothetical protein
VAITRREAKGIAGCFVSLDEGIARRMFVKRRTGNRAGISRRERINVCHPAGERPIRHHKEHVGIV